MKGFNCAYLTFVWVVFICTPLLGPQNSATESTGIYAVIVVEFSIPLHHRKVVVGGLRGFCCAHWSEYNDMHWVQAGGMHSENACSVEMGVWRKLGCFYLFCLVFVLFLFLLG